MGHEHAGDIFAGGLDGDGPDLLGHGRHTVNHAGILILADGVSPRLAHLQKPCGAIPAHAGHDDAHHGAFDTGGHGGKRHQRPERRRPVGEDPSGKPGKRSGIASRTPEKKPPGREAEVTPKS